MKVVIAETDEDASIDLAMATISKFRSGRTSASLSLGQEVDVSLDDMPASHLEVLANPKLHGMFSKNNMWLLPLSGHED